MVNGENGKYLTEIENTRLADQTLGDSGRLPSVDII